MGLQLEIRYYLRVLRELIFPRRCAVCGVPIDNGLCCPACRRHYLLQRLRSFAPREEYLAGQAEPLPQDVLSSVLLLYKYDGILKETLHRIKFMAEAGLLPLLREEAEAALPPAKLRWLGQYDAAVCVPSSPERLQQRGFELPEELFAGLLEQRSTVADAGVLQRRRQTAPLFELGREQRRAELAGCFGLRPGCSVRGKRILLYDDIYTTGSTMAEAARVLLAAGAASVHGLALAAAPANWETEEGR